jgi:Putative peptidoglycan binding domain
MTPTCFPPGQIFDSGKTRQAFAELVELIVFQDYCKQLSNSGLGVCETFFPPIGGRREFFDENAGVARCDALASFLKFHNPSINEQAIVDNCKATNPKPLKAKIPDIISNRFSRLEFYEIKPNSLSGRESGAEKIAWFNILCSSTVANLPYKAGTQYKPNFFWNFNPSNVLGAPFQFSIHIFWAIEGLILYELCPAPSRPRQQEKCSALMRAGGLAAILRLRLGRQLAFTTLDSLIPLAESPLQAAVGRASAAGIALNNFNDVTYVQLLLNDWRGRKGLPLIAEDGVYGQKTDEAITTVQQSIGGVVDGRIDPNRNTIKALERNHLQSAFAGGLEEALDREDTLPTTTDLVIYHDYDRSESGEEMSDDSDPITPDMLLVAIQEEIRTYFNVLYEINLDV